MHEYQRSFIDLAIQNGVLKFGSFTLKSGRQSPFFFNAGLFSSGGALQQLGEFYANAVRQYNEQNVDSRVDFDVLFGPAYKGIPLVVSMSIALSKGSSGDGKGKDDVKFCFNRKEAKDHGEGGNIVGAELKGNVLVVDDVMTAGTAIRESVSIINAQGGKARLCGVVVALDRQERTSQPDGMVGELSAVQQVSQEYGVPVISIVTFDDVVEYLVEKGGYEDEIKKMEEYRLKYGVNSAKK